MQEKTPPSSSSSQQSRNPSGQVQSLGRAIDILNAVANAPDGITLSGIARQVGLPPSTVHRLLTTLQEKRLTRFDMKVSQWF